MNTIRYTIISELAESTFEQFPLDIAVEETPLLKPDFVATQPQVYGIQSYTNGSKTS